ncbi:type VI secretion system contractile sheath domain-containing protein, partial [Pseudomonas viridiflava]|uniref:type VI secretion system contractile sheath domain-containing protein n=1 Tax=Pseudomonas viridiflava TaxID=33069 RepID=UPI001F14BEDF
LEASWRGLKYQVDQTETSTTLKIQLLNASKKDLVRDLKSSSEFDQSALFKKIYEEEYGTFGGAPFGMLLGDYEFNRNPEHMYQDEVKSLLTAVTFAPFILAVSRQEF